MRGNVWVYGYQTVPPISTAHQYMAIVIHNIK